MRGSCERQKLCVGPPGAAVDGVDISPFSGAENTASGSTGTEWLLSTPHSGYMLV